MRKADSEACLVQHGLSQALPYAEWLAERGRSLTVLRRHGVPRADKVQKALNGSDRVRTQDVLQGERLCNVLRKQPKNINAHLLLRTEEEVALLGRLPPNFTLAGDLAVVEATAASLVLPDGLVVEGTLCVTSCQTQLKALHLGVNTTVRGSLSLQNCHVLVRLPSDLHVGGDADLSLCDALTALPERFYVGGRLNLEGCAALTSLPEDLRVCKQLNLHGCSGLHRASKASETDDSPSRAKDAGGKTGGSEPATADCLRKLQHIVTPSGGLDLEGWTNIKALPEEFRVGGNLMMGKCRGLTRIPSGMQVGGRLHLEACSGLAALPNDLLVGAELNLKNCTALRSLPRGLRVGGSINLDRCFALRRLPTDFTVAGSLNLGSGSNIEELPEGLAVNGDLHISSGKIKALPRGIRVGRHMNLERCSALTSLPEDLRVDGDISLHNCSALTALPEHAHFGGSIDLGWCTSLSTMPRRLRVAGKLNMEGCTSLVHLPDELEVEGKFILRRCSALQALPLQLKVGGDLQLTGCPALSALPAGLFVGGDLDVDPAAPVRSLPQHIRIGGHLSLKGCSTLSVVSEGLVVGGGLNLSGCTALVALPHCMRVGGNLNLSNCSSLTWLPDGIKIGGDVLLGRCAVLQMLPECFPVSGKLNMEACSLLTELPKGLCVAGDLDLGKCAMLTALPEGLRVGGDLYLKGCASLASVAPGLLVGGSLHMDATVPLRKLSGPVEVGCNLNMEGLPVLEEVEGDFVVAGCANLSWCPALKRLPDDLQVGRDLCLRGCSALTELPQSFFVAGNLDLEDCAALESLPSSMLQWAPQEPSGQPHRVYLSRSGLSRSALEWLHAADAPGLRISAVDPGQEQELATFPTLSVATAFWVGVSGLPVTVDTQWAASAVSESTLIRFLSRLRDAKEFGLAELRRALAVRVVRVLELMAADSEARLMVLQRMEDALDACGDKPIWALNQMALVVEIAKARGDRNRVRALGRRVMRLMVVHEHAARKVRLSGKATDDVCVYLRFEIALRKPLDLPVQATAMAFPRFVSVTDKELEDAKAEALSIPRAKFAAWLATWPEWRRQIRHEVALDIHWAALEAVTLPRAAVAGLRDQVGDFMRDPVQVLPGSSVWSLADVLRHWVATGLDLHNAPVSVSAMRAGLRRVERQSSKRPASMRRVSSTQTKVTKADGTTT